MLLFPNDNHNLRKYIIDFIFKITNVFSNRATSEHHGIAIKLAALNSKVIVFFLKIVIIEIR